jgi:pilus assembly protein CpaB
VKGDVDMSERLRTVTIAIALGLIATVGVGVYLNSLKADIVESGVKQSVFVVSAEIPAGTMVSEIIDKSMAVRTEIPKRYVVVDAVQALEDHKDQMTVVNLSPGDQVTQGKLRPASESDVIYKLAPDKIALAVPVDEITGVGGTIRTGDRVVVVATMEPGPGGADLSRILMSGIEVLAAHNDGDKSSIGSNNVKKTITLAVSPDEAEKLVFAQETGRVWLGLTSSKSAGISPTGGRTTESLFQ